MPKSACMWLLCLVIHHTQAESTPPYVYKHYKNQFANSIHTVTFDPLVLNLRLIRAQDLGSRFLKPSTFAKKTNAIAVTNAGFFMKNGAPAHVCKADNIWYRTPTRARGAVGWSDHSQQFLFDRLTANVRVNFAGKSLRARGVNVGRYMRNAVYNEKYLEEVNIRKRHHAYLYENNRLIQSGTNKDYRLAPNQWLFAKYGAKQSKRNSGRADYTIHVKPRIQPELGDNWSKVQNIIGGAPLLLLSGVKMDPRAEKVPRSFYDRQLPRTAICQKSDGNIMLMVVDATSTSSRGMTINELSETLLAAGCQHALNLDGGGSTCMVVNKKVMSNTVFHDDELGRYVYDELPVADALVLTDGIQG